MSDQPIGFAVWDKPSNDWRVVLFMVDCPTCAGHGVLAEFEGLRVDCKACNKTGKQRNPALGWGEWCDTHHDSCDDYRSDCSFRWVAVGVKMCVSCDARPPRTLPDPIPEGYPMMWLEAICGYGLYCQTCFDATKSPADPDA